MIKFPIDKQFVKKPYLEQRNKGNLETVKEFSQYLGESIKKYVNATFGVWNNSVSAPVI
mgnify:CR=1